MLAVSRALLHLCWLFPEPWSKALETASTGTISATPRPLERNLLLFAEHPEAVVFLFPLPHPIASSCVPEYLLEFVIVNDAVLGS